MANRANSPITTSSSVATSELISLTLTPSDSRPATNLHSVLLIYVAIEFLAVASAAYFSSVLYHHMLLEEQLDIAAYAIAAITIAGLISSISVALHNFTGIQKQRRHVFLWKSLLTVALCFPIFLTVLFFTHFAGLYSRGTYVIQLVTVAMIIASGRMLLYSSLQVAIATNQIAARRVFFVGPRDYTHNLVDKLKSNGIQTVGIFYLDGSEGIAPTSAILHTLIPHVRSLSIDEIIIVAKLNNTAATLDLAAAFSELPVGVHFVPLDATNILSAGQFSEFGSLQTIQLYRHPLSKIELTIKRAFDITAATLGLIFLSPLLLFVSIAIKLDSSGPILFKQRRHGFNNEIIHVFKFRSMISAKNGDQFVQATEEDPRVTSVGRIIRRTNIDELPQLINVLRGDMSIVGPRPHATSHNEIFIKMIKPFSRRHTVKPGITGWAQVNGYRGATDTLEKMQRRIEYDLYYVDHWSFLFDLKIIMLTLFSKAAYNNAY